MPGRNYYLFKNGRLARKDNTLYLRPIRKNEEQDALSDFDRPIPIPVEDVEDIYLFGQNLLNTKLLSFLAQNNICLHAFDYYGHYTGSFVPRDFLPSGCVQLQQAVHIIDHSKRLDLARQFVSSAIFHCVRNLRYRDNRGTELAEEIERIDALDRRLAAVDSIEELMGLEGNVHRVYYQGLGKIVPEEFQFQERSRRPPKNPFNAAMSFINMLVYTACLGQIYRTHLSPVMSFLHTPGTQRFSLSLDIAEIFKPLIGDRLLIRMLNQKQLQSDDFRMEGNACLLTDKSCKKVAKEWDAELKKTVKHRKLGRNVSYRSLIRMECYKIEKSVMGIESYNALRAWW